MAGIQVCKRSFHHSGGQIRAESIGAATGKTAGFRQTKAISRSRLSKNT